MPCFVLSLLTHPGGWWKDTAGNPLELVRKLIKSKTDLTLSWPFLKVLSDGKKLYSICAWLVLPFEKPCWAVPAGVSFFCFHLRGPMGSVPVKGLSLQGRSSVKGWVKATGFGSCKTTYPVQLPSLDLQDCSAQLDCSENSISRNEKHAKVPSRLFVLWLPVGLGRAWTFLTSETIIAIEIQLRQDFWSFSSL